MDEIQSDAQPFEGATGAGTLPERPNLRLADRLKHIRDHRRDTRDSPTARTIALRGVCSDLMEIEACVAEALRGAVAATPMTAENIDQYSPSIDLVIRLAKQITQMSQLEVRSSKHED